MNKQISVHSFASLTPLNAEPFNIIVVHGNSPDKKRPFLGGINLLNKKRVIFVGAFANKQLLMAAARDRAALHLDGAINVDDLIGASN